MVQPIYEAIRHALYRDGECTCSIGGAEYRFLYTGFGAEVTRNGDFMYELSHDWEIAELLDELAVSI